MPTTEEERVLPMIVTEQAMNTVSRLFQASAAFCVTRLEVDNGKKEMKEGGHESRATLCGRSLK